MWKKWLAFAGMLALVIMLDPTHTPAQPGGGKGKGKRDGGNGSGGLTPGGPGGGLGGFGSGSPGGGMGRGPGGTGSGFGGPGSGMGGFGSGAPGGGMGGFGSSNPGGGMGRGRGIDPETGWKMLSNMTGGDGQTVDLGKIPPQMQGFIKTAAERSGGLALPESGVMTKADYLDFHARSEAARASFSASNGGNPMGQGGWGQGQGGWGGFGGWGQGQGQGQGGWGQGNRPGFEPKQTEEERPVAMRYGKLPKGLPGWYDEYDTDKDGQVSLYEWRKAKQKTEDFAEMDLNGDGLVTADEYLRFARQKNIDTKVAEYEDGLRGPGNWGLGEKLSTGNEQPTRPNNGKSPGGFGGFGFGQKGGDGEKGGKKSDRWPGMKKN